MSCLVLQKMVLLCSAAVDFVIACRGFLGFRALKV